MKKMNIVINNGYVLNKESQCLESLTIKKITANFTKETVVYECLLGGVETTISDNNLQVYQTESHFERGQAWKASSLSDFYSLFFRVYKTDAHSVDNVPMAWVFRDGQAEFIPIPEMTFTIHVTDSCVSSVTSDVDMKFYHSREKVYEYNDYQVKDDNGDVVLHKSTATLLALNDEQQKLVDDLRENIKKLVNSGARLFFDQDDWRLRVVSGVNVDKIEQWGDYDDDYISIQDFTIDVCGNGYIKGADSASYDIMAVFKEGVRTQKL